MPSAGEEDSHGNRNSETRQKLCGVVRYVVSCCGGLAVMAQEPETWVRSPVATHLSLTSLNLLVSSLAPDSKFNWNPVTVRARKSHRVNDYGGAGTKHEYIHCLR